MMKRLPRAPISSIRWYPKVILRVGFFLENQMKTKETTKPNRSVTRWKASLMTEMECEMMPPMNSPAMKTKEMMMTMMSFLKLPE